MIYKVGGYCKQNLFHNKSTSPVILSSEINYSKKLIYVISFLKPISYSIYHQTAYFLSQITLSAKYLVFKLACTSDLFLSLKYFFSNSKIKIKVVLSFDSFFTINLCSFYSIFNINIHIHLFISIIDVNFAINDQEY